MIKPDFIDTIRTLPIKEVVERFIRNEELKKAGTNWRCKSPFNDERTPSFNVIPRLNIFKDFSSGNAGDGIRFVQLVEKCSFVEAIEKIAGSFNLQIEYERPATPEEQKILERSELLFKINQSAANRFAEALRKSDPRFSTLPTDATQDLTYLSLLHFQRNGRRSAHRVFRSRGRAPQKPVSHVFDTLVLKRRFTLPTIIQWQLGYAPPGWNFITRLVHEKAKTAEARDLGLIKEKEGRHYDAFRHRLMFPIFNHHGRIVSFGGRLLPGGSEVDQAKYLNGSDSPIYNKSRVLYGLNFAGSAIRTLGFVNIMEGYADVVSFHQAGYTNTVGTCGTALTPEQCALLKRYANKAVLYFDPDNAGQKATERAIDLLLAHGFEVHVVKLPVLTIDKEEIEQRTNNGHPLPPDKVDPDELVRMLRPETII